MMPCAKFGFGEDENVLQQNDDKKILRSSSLHPLARVKIVKNIVDLNFYSKPVPAIKLHVYIYHYPNSEE